MDDLSSAHVYLRLPQASPYIPCMHAPGGVHAPQSSSRSSGAVLSKTARLKTGAVVKPLQGVSWDAIPEETLEDCAQLVKANSIQGNKMDSVGVVYTPVSNLKKTQSMEVGQVCAAQTISVDTLEAHSSCLDSAVTAAACCHACLL